MKQLNTAKMIAWGVAQGNRLYEAFPTRKEARKVKKIYENCNNNEKFKIVKLKFDKEVR